MRRISIEIFFIFNQFLSFPIWVRISVASVLIFPIGFFLGMPFPLGILLLEKQPKGVIAWARRLNALFTVVGGYASVLLSIYLGFLVTLLIALLFYTYLYFCYPKKPCIYPKPYPLRINNLAHTF